MATAEELKAQLAKLEKEQAIKDEKDRKASFGKSKLYDVTKIVIVATIIFLVCMGTFGSMHIGPFVKFSMDDFVKFLQAFSPFFIALTGGISAGGIAKNIAKGIAEKKNGDIDPGEGTT
jgi:hypothetical protein